MSVGVTAKVGVSAKSGVDAKHLQRYEMEIEEKVQKAIELVTAHILAAVREEMSQHRIQVRLAFAEYKCNFVRSKCILFVFKEVRMSVFAVL